MHKLENGIHDLPNEVYHGSEGLSRSALWEFKKSPWHYWHKYLNPNRIPQHSTPAMKLGELVHALVLEPQYFIERYAVKPILFDVPRCGLLKDLGREEFEKQKRERELAQGVNERMMLTFATKSEGREIITDELYAEARKYADAVLSDSVAQALFTNVRVENSIYFTHKKTGLQCKVRPDAWAGSVVTDLKTCIDASFDAFQSAAYRSGYFIQAAMIKQALESIGIELEKFIFYCVEKTPGIPCVYYELEPEALLRANSEFDTLMYGIADCFESNSWDSYSSQSLNYPNWAKI